MFIMIGMVLTSLGGCFIPYYRTEAMEKTDIDCLYKHTGYKGSTH
jgi:hypothetical protein